jgi:hypothetical protein
MSYVCSARKASVKFDRAAEEGGRQCGGKLAIPAKLTVWEAIKKAWLSRLRHKKRNKGPGSGR